MRKGVRADSHAGIGHAEHHVSPRFDGSLVVGNVGMQFNVAGLNPQLPPVGHGVARVDDQVQNYLLDLTWIGFDGAQIFFDACSHLDRFAHQAAHHLVHVQNDAVQIQHFRFQDLLAAEGEQLPNQRDGPLRSVRNLLYVSAKLGMRRDARKSQLYIPLDDGQQVIEIVRHSSGEPAHCFHAVSLLQLVFEQMPFRDVDDDAFH